MPKLTPTCPLCRQYPIMDFGETAVCGNDDCKVIFWRPDLSLDDNLLNVGTVDIQPKPDNKTE